MNYTIICVSPAPWDYPIWTNRQHIMHVLSKNNDVYYIFHPEFLRSTIKRNILSPKKINHIKENKYRLKLITPYILPFAKSFLNIHKLNVKICSTLINRRLKEGNIKNYILWFYDPESVFYLKYLNPTIACYDCVDEFSAMPSYNSQKKIDRLLKLEKLLVKKCDIVFTTSNNLYSEKKKYNSKTFLVENVGDFKHFYKTTKVKPINLKQIPPNKKNIGFIGALDSYKVDYELLEWLSIRQPDWNFILIGSKLNILEKEIHLKGSKNIFFLGIKKYKDLPYYAANFDICIIPYKINDYTKNVFPIKVFEYLATGKPVVSTNLPSIRKYKDVIFISDDYLDFENKIKIALVNNNISNKEKRLQIAYKNSWESRSEKLIKIVKEEFDLKLNSAAVSSLI